jgi:hypothetical protein
VPIGEEPVAQVGSEKSGGPGNQNPHSAPRPIER